jgi:hypothetical protein
MRNKTSLILDSFNH